MANLPPFFLVKASQGTLMFPNSLLSCDWWFCWWFAVSFHRQRSSGGPLVLNTKRLVTFPRFLPSHVRHTWKVTGIWCMCLVMFAVHTNITRALTVCKSHLPNVRQRSGSSKISLLCKMWQIFLAPLSAHYLFFPAKWKSKLFISAGDRVFFSLKGWILLLWRSKTLGKDPTSTTALLLLC